MILKLELKLLVLRFLGLIGALVGLATTVISGFIAVYSFVLSCSAVVESIVKVQPTLVETAGIAGVFCALSLYILALSLHSVRVCSLMVFPQLETLFVGATPEERTKLDNLTKGWASSTPKIGLAMACTLFAIGLAWTFLFS